MDAEGAFGLVTGIRRSEIEVCGLQANGIVVSGGFTSLVLLTRWADQVAVNARIIELSWLSVLRGVEPLVLV